MYIIYNILILYLIIYVLTNSIVNAQDSNEAHTNSEEANTNTEGIETKMDDTIVNDDTQGDIPTEQLGKEYGIDGEEYVEEDVEEEVVRKKRAHPLSDIPNPLPEITYYVHFPDEGKEKLPLGSPVSVLVGLINTGKNDITINYVMGSINNPQIFSYYYQNFTKRDLNTTLKAYSEITVHYRFATYYDLEPSVYQLAMTIFYENTKNEYATTFFNETVKFYDSRKGIDYYLFFSFLVVSALLASTIFIFCEHRLPKRKNIISQTQSTSDEWLSSTLIKDKKE